jgi:hypothetical protein
MTDETNQPFEKQGKDSFTLANPLFEQTIKIYLDIAPYGDSKTTYEVAVIIENETVFTLSELRLEAKSNLAARLLSLPFFEQIRQLGSLGPFQKSRRQLFRVRWETSAGPLEQAIIEFRIFGQPERSGLKPVELLVVTCLAAQSSRLQNFKLLS